jgi:hypothetical protein
VYQTSSATVEGSRTRRAPNKSVPQMESLQRNLRVVNRTTPQGSESWEASAQDGYQRDNARDGAPAGNGWRCFRLVAGAKLQDSQELMASDPLCRHFRCSHLQNPGHCCNTHAQSGWAVKRERSISIPFAVLPVILLTCSIGDAPFTQRTGASQGWGKQTAGKCSRAATLESTLFVVKVTIRANPSAEAGLPGEHSR